MDTREIAVRNTAGWPVIDRLATHASDRDYLLGLTIVAVLPAMFWVGVIRLAAGILEFPFNTSAAVLVGSSIVTFLGMTYTFVIRPR